MIAILIAALIVAILWAARFRDEKEKEARDSEKPGIRSLQDVPKAIDKARQVDKQQRDRSNEMNKKMRDVDP